MKALQNLAKQNLLEYFLPYKYLPALGPKTYYEKTYRLLTSFQFEV